MENTIINLTTEDKQHCDALFSVYSDHVTHVSELIQIIEKNSEEYLSRNIDRNRQYFSISVTEKDQEAIEVLTDTQETLTQLLILNIEEYFKEKYCLSFSSLIPDRGKINLDPVPSYDFIIDNISTQVGKNFLLAGKQQIIRRFWDSFYADGLPVLKGNKITIAHFISIDEHYSNRISLDYRYNARMDNLLNALNLFLND
jgi:hypothetical protein